MALLDDAYNNVSELVQKFEADTDFYHSPKYQESNLRLYSEREQFQRKFDYLDCEIDKLVYQFYGLTDEEIKIVENV